MISAIFKLSVCITVKPTIAIKNHLLMLLTSKCDITTMAKFSALCFLHEKLGVQISGCQI